MAPRRSNGQRRRSHRRAAAVGAAVRPRRQPPESAKPATRRTAIKLSLAGAQVHDLSHDNENDADTGHMTPATAATRPITIPAGMEMRAKRIRASGVIRAEGYRCRTAVLCQPGRREDCCLDRNGAATRLAFLGPLQRSAMIEAMRARSVVVAAI